MDVRECNDLPRAEAAVRYARLGWYVLPVWWANEDGSCGCGDAECSNQGKHPLSALVPHGHTQATTDPTWVADWWRQYPNANIGVSCAATGFLALDVDQGKVLPEDWPDFVNAGVAPPRTLVQRSGNANPAHHVLYSTKTLPADVRIRGKVAARGVPGVDKMLIRHNGFIVVAPSVHKSGQKYRWLNTERIADPGPILLPRLTFTPSDAAQSGGGSGDGVVSITSFRDLTQLAVNRAEEGESRAEVGHWLACQLRDNACARGDAESIFLPAFYRETVGMRPDAPDARIVGRWLQNAYSTPPRAALPGFDPQVRQVMERAAAAAAANGHAAPTEAPDTTPMPERTAAVANGPETVTEGAETPLQPTPVRGRPAEPLDVAPLPTRPTMAGGTILQTMAEILEEEQRNPLNATDVGNARRFVRLFHGRALYVADVGRWYLWDGNRWKPDLEGIALRYAADVVDDIREQALLTNDPDDRQRWNSWAHQTESIGHQLAILKLASARMAVPVAVFDRNPELMVVRNGTLDLRTCKLRPSNPNDLCSRQAAVTYDAAAECPRWRAHVRFVSNSDLELASYLRRAIGYTITGLTSERAFFFLTGDGSNGKNVFIEPIMELLGEYGKTASSALLEGGNEQHPTIIADLLGARLVFVDETREGKRLNAERIKTLTGSKRIKARFMRQDQFEFEPNFKLWITGNGRPVVRDPSDGAWKRLHEVPCRGKVGVDVALIKDYGDILYADEASGILNWALEGLQDWRTTGLLKPQSVQDAIDEHRDEEDYVGQFLDECMVMTNNMDQSLLFSAVYEEYARWAKVQQLRGENFLSKIPFGRRLTKHMGRPSRGFRVNGEFAKRVEGVTWSNDASIEARIMTGQATTYV